MPDEVKDTKLTLQIPGEWALQKVFGATLDELGQDLKTLYARGRDRIIASAVRKIKDQEDGQRTNLRVTQDVLVNGSFTDDEICAEYFGGILASSRSADGKNDDPIQFATVIKSLSSRQLRLHYMLYKCLNSHLIGRGDTWDGRIVQELSTPQLWFATGALGRFSDVEVDFPILYRQGLVTRYQTSGCGLSGNKLFRYVTFGASTFGILLYAAAHNRLDWWHEFSTLDFGTFSDVRLPEIVATSLEELIEKRFPGEKPLPLL